MQTHAGGELRNSQNKRGRRDPFMNSGGRAPADIIHRRGVKPEVRLTKHLRRLSVRLRRSRSNTSTECSFPGGAQGLLNYRKNEVILSLQGRPCRFSRNHTTVDYFGSTGTKQRLTLINHS